MNGRQRRLATIAAAAALLLVGTGAALAADLGANDDTGKYAQDAGVAFYQRMAALGLKQTVLTVRWIPSDPLGLQERDLLDETVPAAQAAGLKVVFAVYPYPPREIESGLARPVAFAAWLDMLARRYPTVRQFVVGNEPNQPAFFRPQFSRKGRQLSASRFGQFLAAGYDALKAIDPAITVIGVGLSPRGNDRPFAKSNISTSPIRFLASLGTWYRSTKRDRPLMDGFSFHPYPNKATDSLARGYPWPNAGFVNLDRIKQALWDAFDGTAQPTTLNGLRLYLDEVGWQVDTAGLAGYTGTENVPVTTDEEQAEVYGELVRRATCDPDIAEVNVFGFYDDPLRTGFQAALHRADGSPRASAEAVQAAVRQAQQTCTEATLPWAPITTVLGVLEPSVTVSGGSLVAELAAGEGARVLACVFPGRPNAATVRESLAFATPKTQGCAAGIATATRSAIIMLQRLAGRSVVGGRLIAESNRSRIAFVRAAVA